ncbi:sulfotransferase family protein [Dactylococcopsis salina PCC 8305]|uniref:Sulfotransferase family protein n=2 Tax=Dactylococcopsis salina TaxID=292566 RepID=K9YRT9_DACS8|nr:sulfotransferase family protein [Dactylococcopsis salina PCC 8305]
MMLKNRQEQKEIIKAYNLLRKPPSVIFYTTHKCASVFVNKLLSCITKNSDYRLKNYSSAIWSLGNQIDVGSPYEDFLEKAYDRLYKTKGEIYAPQRRPLDFPGRENFKHIFFLRDPRDVLVSGYYSFGYSHKTPKAEKQKQKFNETRVKIREQGIDNYACEAAINWLLPLYDKYRELLETSDTHLYLTYDEFKDDTTRFIQKIADFLEVNVPEKEIQEIANEASPVQQNKDIMQHKRSGLSQQYLTELESDTIQKLNETFAEVLSYWNFPI